jgi:glycosyltransferase involved in cell wall biosynthesis
LKILILTQYYPPETGAPQNRLHELAVRLSANGVQVQVLTAMPNYPKMEIMPGYEGKRYVKETIDGIVVHRSAIYVPKNRGMVSRLRNYFSFVWSAATTGARNVEARYDYVLCESPPLFLALAAFRICRKARAKLIFNVSDLWPESAEKLGIVRNRFFLWLAYRLEAMAYRRAHLVTGQTQGICADIAQRFPQVKTYWLPNGVDLTLYDPAVVQPVGFREKNGISPGQFVVFYGGIVGHAQGLDTLLEAADLLKAQARITFVILGEGPEKERLQQAVASKQLRNVLLLPGVPKEAMKAIISEVDAGVIPLKRLKLFEGAIPSKIFEILAMEKPVILGVEGEAKSLFIDQGRTGLSYTPEDAASLAKAVEQLAANTELCTTLGRNGRAYASRKFDRNEIAAAFLKVL